MTARRNRYSRHDFATEADLAKVVVAWLKAEGWVVFQEVEARPGIADIVATREDVAVVECKLSLGLTVLDQAHRWRHHAHFSYAAVPSYGSRGTRDFARVICGALGLGLLEVSAPDTYLDQPGRVKVATIPVRQDASGTLAAKLRPEHQDYAEAGSPTGHRWTRFRETERDLVAYVREHPGELAKTAVAAIRHHWQGKKPHGTVLQLIERKVITEIRVEKTREGARLYPVEVMAPAPVPVPPTPAPLRPPVDTGAAAELLATRALRDDDDVLGTILTVSSAAVAVGVTSAALEAAIGARLTTTTPPAPAPSSTATSSPRTSSRRRSRAWQITPP